MGNEAAAGGRGSVILGSLPSCVGFATGVSHRGRPRFNQIWDLLAVRPGYRNSVSRIALFHRSPRPGWVLGEMVAGRRVNKQIVTGFNRLGGSGAGLCGS